MLKRYRDGCGGTMERERDEIEEIEKIEERLSEVTGCS